MSFGELIRPCLVSTKTCNYWCVFGQRCCRRYSWIRIITSPYKPPTDRQAQLLSENLLIIEKNLSTNLGDEGGFAPSLSNNEEAIEFILKAIDNAGFKAGEDVTICLDIAANELFKDNKYAINSTKFISPEKTTEYYLDLIKKYPIKSIEDPFFEDDWDAWINLTKSLKNQLQI